MENCTGTLLERKRKPWLVSFLLYLWLLAQTCMIYPTFGQYECCSWTITGCGWVSMKYVNVCLSLKSFLMFYSTSPNGMMNY